jgi:hypothetical protein
MRFGENKFGQGLFGEPPPVAQFVVSDKGVEMMKDLPPYFHDDPTLVKLMTAVGNELQRIEDFLNVLRTKMFPAAADDEYGILAAYERLYGLPVQPLDASIETRRAILLTAIARRRAGAGKGWVDMINAVLGGATWTYDENDPSMGKLTMHLPIDADSYRAGQALALVEFITPANIQLLVNFEGGAAVGTFHVGDPLG